MRPEFIAVSLEPARRNPRFIIVNRVVWDSNSEEALNGKRHATEAGIEAGIEEWKPIEEAKETGRLRAQVGFLDSRVFGQRPALAG